MGAVTTLAVARLAYDEVRRATLLAAALGIIANIATACAPPADLIYAAPTLGGRASGIFI